MILNERYLVFGDIHGYYKAAAKAVELTKTENAKGVFLGDYVGRGPDSIKTLEVLIEAKKQNPDWIFLRGNHDQMLLDLILGVTKPNIEFKILTGFSSNDQTNETYIKWKNSTPALKKKLFHFLKALYFTTRQKIGFLFMPL